MRVQLKNKYSRNISGKNRYFAVITSPKHSCWTPRSSLLRLPHSHELSRNDICLGQWCHRTAQRAPVGIFPGNSWNRPPGSNVIIMLAWRSGSGSSFVLTRILRRTLLACLGVIRVPFISIPCLCRAAVVQNRWRSRIRVGVGLLKFRAELLCVARSAVKSRAQVWVGSLKSRHRAFSGRWKNHAVLLWLAVCW